MLSFYSLLCRYEGDQYWSGYWVIVNIDPLVCLEWHRFINVFAEMFRKAQTHVHAFLVGINREVLSASIHNPPPIPLAINIGSKQVDFWHFNGMAPHRNQQWVCTYKHSYPASVQYVWGVWQLWMSVGICNWVLRCTVGDVNRYYTRNILDTSKNYFRLLSK